MEHGWNTEPQVKGLSTVPNRRPQAQPQCLLVGLNTATPITLAGRDGDSDPLTYSLTVAPTRGVLSGTAPNLTYTPNNNVSGPDYFCFVANDGKADSHPAVVTLAINSSANPPPVVTLLTPATHAWFVGPTNIVLTATASDPDGIYAVEFYEGTKALAQLFTPPFTFTWTNPPPGPYTLLAKADDAGGRRGLSAPVSVRVLGAMPLVNVRPTGWFRDRNASRTPTQGAVCLSELPGICPWPRIKRHRARGLRAISPP